MDRTLKAHSGALSVCPHPQEIVFVQICLKLFIAVTTTSVLNMYDFPFLPFFFFLKCYKKSDLKLGVRASTNDCSV